MRGSSVTRRLLAAADVRDWEWWRLPGLLRWYVAAVPLAALAAAGLAAAHTAWHPDDLVKFLLLLGCGLVSVAATRRIAYAQGAMVRDFLTVWVLPIAILLPPFYALVAPIPLLVLTQWGSTGAWSTAGCSRPRPSAWLTARRRSCSARSPRLFAGGAIGTGRHALTWTVAVTVAEIAGETRRPGPRRLAIKLSDPGRRSVPLDLNRETLAADLAELDLAVLTTVVVALNPIWLSSRRPPSCWPGGS